ncbi:response regulator [bacterium]|nr:response regulator [bacterium]
MNEKKIKVLIAEDDPFLSRMYSEKLELENFDVILAVDGQEAIDKIKINKPDVVILDLLMPKKTGFEVLSEKESDKGIKDIPVIVLTNLSQKEDIKKCYDLGAKDFLIKAYFVPSEVIKKIETVLSK